MISPLFVGHGSPLMAIQDSPCTEFLAAYGKKSKPKAIVVFTAHWESELLTISSVEGTYDTIYDFGGFPPEMYAIKYPAPGDPELAKRIGDRLEKLGIAHRFDTKRGLDHGSWVPLRRMYPEADIPVVQVSVHPFLPPGEQFRIGTALRGLDQEDILVLGSGATVHNFRAMNFNAKGPDAWAVAFDDWLVDRIQSKRLDELFRYEELAPNAKAAVPRPEHFVPLYLAFGSADPASSATEAHRSYEMGSLSYLSIEF
ncbi:DODA-type extradiol aromatic ring-opening family dioxygenase [Cohnella thailandensis]|uniref:Dioxygenase n=1 Tax=Cohnella thailandensis TaxID=557557 RepID=A0A841SY38_9BACL|nr:class III extradiol ring-cleavage dioxygenase [Cohnella thailandensis]MBB6636824.1 dioxygenase [Cohnella thailandensis]MBP1973299.1 4,5-DOPA dioxygenase extradiol [Cohnella thailandensis]